MRRIAALLALNSLSTLAAAAAPPDNEAPALSAPVLTAPAIEPIPAPSPTVTSDPKPEPARRPLLVVPGITPQRRPRTAAPSDTAPALSGPAGMAPPPATPAAPVRTGPNGRALPPSTVESAVSSGSVVETPPIEIPLARRVIESPRTTPPPRKPAGLFERLFPSASPRNRSTSPTDIRPSEVTESRIETAADVALKRRVIKQVRDKLGGRVSSFDVQVSDRTVTIKARPTRFWQRRGVKNDLESMPTMKGYKTVVELVD